MIRQVRLGDGEQDRKRRQIASKGHRSVKRFRALPRAYATSVMHHKDNVRLTEAGPWLYEFRQEVEGSIQNAIFADRVHIFPAS